MGQHVLIAAAPDSEYYELLGGRAGQSRHDHDETVVTISSEVSGMWGARPVGGGGGAVHVELITYLQLLVGHGEQSVHVVGEEVGGAHVHVVI